MKERYRLLDCSRYQYLNPYCFDAPGTCLERFPDLCPRVPLGALFSSLFNGFMRILRWHGAIALLRPGSGVDDLAEFEAVVKAFDSMGMKEEQRHTIWSAVSGVLLLGNVKTVGEEGLS